MNKMIPVILILLFIPIVVLAEDNNTWTLITNNHIVLTEISECPSVGDEYISADNKLYKVLSVLEDSAVLEYCGEISLPSLEWMDVEHALPVSANTRYIAMYCTHSDESYEPTDGYYSTMEKGTIYEVAQELADALEDQNIEAEVSQTLHHPHDAGAYRRSRQTAVQLIKNRIPDCLIDIHRDGIPDPASYAVTIGGVNASKIRLLVGRGNQNADINKEFALMIKAVADRVYPGLIKDIYLGKGTFNQDLLPQSILFECGTYTLSKDRVFASMPMMADVLNRSLYGGLIGSVGKTSSDIGQSPQLTAGFTMGKPDQTAETLAPGIGKGIMFLIILLFVGIAGFAVLSAGSLKCGRHKAERAVSEMTGGLIGKEPDANEEHEHS